VQLAKHFETCILSADSRQFYKEIAIGTAKPSLEEQEGIKHYFVDSHNLDDEVTSAQYEKEALSILQDEFKSKEIIILTGGSGMFIDALCIGLDNIPSSKETKETIQAEYDANGVTPLLNELKTSDLEYFNAVDQKNIPRIIRAIEVIRLTGKTYSELRKAKPKARPFKIHRFVLNHERQILYERINKRVDIMIQEGIIEEARSVEHLKHLTSLNTVGYKELFSFFNGEITEDRAIELIKQNSRRYAKRQITWFKRHPESKWIDFQSINQTITEITQAFTESRSLME
tara:strand:+ start:2406 stop:3266 length:861 start_codon:yes stop_codon:yes gene_type:complete